MLFQVFTNYLTNAIKFSPAESTITASFSSDDKHVYVSIEDHGIGIPAQIVPRLGKPSHVVSRDGTDGEQGSGHGILIAQNFLEKYGACCQYKSVEAHVDPVNQGTTVHLRFNKAGN